MIPKQLLKELDEETGFVRQAAEAYAETPEDFKASLESALEIGMIRDSRTLLDLLSERLSGASDYRIAKLLDVSESTVSKWRVGKGGMSDHQVIKTAAIVGLDPLYALHVIYAARTKSVGAKFILENSLEVAEKSGRAVLATVVIGFSALLMGSAMMPPGDYILC